MNQQIICTACGTQFPLSSDRPELYPVPGNDTPELCPICNDDRQYIPEKGQGWTTLKDLSDNYGVIIKKINEHLYELIMAPSFAIGQRALLVLTPGGNILWDCIALLNEPTIAFIKSKGGLKAIAFSHPHYYSTMNEWGASFDCPIYIHERDEPWVYNKGPRIRLWSGIEHSLWDGIRILHIGGHFPGSSILHIPFLSPEGTVLCGDTFAISPHKKHISVMYSYPNRIPLPLQEMQRIKRLILPLPFDTLFGYAEFLTIYSDAKQILENSLAKYV
jgi:glyoxylase-like metal-dependent hydrolase (beta-lactamase superfamily II)